MNLLNNIQHNTKKQFWLFVSVLVFLTLFTMYCCSPTTSYWGYDFFFHLRRFDVLIEALKNGSYPMYFDYSNIDGYGYFTKGFYPDITLLPFALVGTFTGTYFAYDFMIFTMTILCGVFAYKAVNTIIKSPFAASVAAILYTFATYRLYDVYHRFALGEALSFTFLPLIFLGLYHIIAGDYKKWYILAIGYSLLIYTHLISSVLTFFMLIPFLLYYYKRFIKEPKRFLYLLLAAVVTLLIVSYYIFPTLEQMASNIFYYETRSPGGPIVHNKLPYNLVAWGFINGLAYPKDEFFCGTGILLTIAILLRIFIRGKSSKLRMVDIGVLVGILCIIGTFKEFPWGRPPFSYLGFIQYPARLYEFTTVFFALAGGYYLSEILKNSKQRFIAFVIIIVATMGVIVNHSIIFKELFAQNRFRYYEGVADKNPTIDNKYHLIGQEYIPDRVPSVEFLHQRGLKVEHMNEDTKIENLRRENKYTIFDVSVNKADSLELPLLFYKGYNVILNQKEIPVTQSKNGLIEVPVNQSGEVKAYYKGTTIQWVSFCISILCIFGLCIYIFLSKKKPKQPEKGINI